MSLKTLKSLDYAMSLVDLEFDATKGNDVNPR